MTIVDVACYSDRALVGADSVMARGNCQLVRDAAGAVIHDHKLVHLRAANCILSLTGALRLREHLRDALQDAAGLDDIAERLPDIARSAPAHITASARTRYPGGNSVVCVGWSAHHESMAIVAFVSSRGFEAEWHVPPQTGASYWLGPSIPLPPFYRYPETAVGMFDLARLQADHFRIQHADAPLGGPFRVATITRTSIAFEMIGDLGLPQSVEPLCDRSGSPCRSLPPVAEETTP